MKTKVSAVLFAALLVIGYARAEDLFFDSAGVQIHYIVEGRGEPVLLIHGYTGDARTGWVEPGIVSALAKDYQVIALDNRGHGQSGKPHDPQEYGPKMAEDAVRLLDFLKIQKAHVVGYSMGGRITVNLLGNHPDRLRSAVVGGAGWMDANELDVRRAGMNAIAESLEQGRGLGPLFIALTPRGGQPPSAAQMEWINKFLLARNDAMALSAVARAMVSLQPPLEKVRVNKVPALAVVGEVDPRRGDAERLVSVMPNIKLSVIPGANHMTAVRNPEFLKRVQAFLAAHAETAKATEPRTVQQPGSRPAARLVHGRAADPRDPGRRQILQRENVRPDLRGRCPTALTADHPASRLDSPPAKNRSAGASAAPAGSPSPRSHRAIVPSPTPIRAAASFCDSPSVARWRTSRSAPSSPPAAGCSPGAGCTRSKAWPLVLVHSSGWPRRWKPSTVTTAIRVASPLGGQFFSMFLA